MPTVLCFGKKPFRDENFFRIYLTPPDITERLKLLNRPLYLQAQAVLDRNKRERHIRGGQATKEKYRTARGEGG